MDRRTFLQASSLLATAGVAPGFLARAAETAKPGDDRVLVVVEMTGGNDGLNTVIPHADGLYYKARPTLGVPKNRTLRVDAEVGLHPRLTGLNDMLDKGELAIVLGVGYPNPNRSHFDSMDIWQSADPTRALKTGWIGRTLPGMKASKSGMLAMHVAAEKLPLAFQETSGVISLSDPSSFTLRLSGKERAAKRKKLIETLNAPGASPSDDLAAFVRGRQSQVLSGVETLEKVLNQRDEKDPDNPRLYRGRRIGQGNSPLGEQLALIARMVKAGIGARVYYASIEGFDTHTGQANSHANLLGDLGNAVGQFFEGLREDGLGKRVVLMTYSEFGRRVQENGSKGTDHGAASHLFVAGPPVKGGLVGKYPRLDDLTDGDMKFGIDFRRVYATLLDGWLGCNSKDILGGRFEHLPLLAKA